MSDRWKDVLARIVVGLIAAALFGGIILLHERREAFEWIDYFAIAVGAACVGTFFGLMIPAMAEAVDLIDNGPPI